MLIIYPSLRKYYWTTGKQSDFSVADPKPQLLDSGLTQGSAFPAKELQSLEERKEQK